MHPATPENGRKASTRPGLLENSFSTRKQPPELLRKVHRRRLPWRNLGVIFVLRAEGDLGPIGIAIRQAIRFVERSSLPATWRRMTRIPVSSCRRARSNVSPGSSVPPGRSHFPGLTGSSAERFRRRILPAPSRMSAETAR